MDDATTIPATLAQFAAKYSIDTSHFSVAVPKCLRVWKPTISSSSSESALPSPSEHGHVQLEKDLSSIQAQPLQWLSHIDSLSSSAPFFYVTCPSGTPVASLPSYKTGNMFGIDAASVCAVIALGIEPRHRVLDLCCAPGAKFLTIASTFPCAALWGVDISYHRLCACRSLVTKYRGHILRVQQQQEDFHMRLVHCDSCVFSDAHHQAVLYDSLCLQSHAPARHPRRTAQKQLLDGGSAELDASTPLRLFDRILVDAECSHDGSTKHMNKFHENFLSDDYMSRLVGTQLRILKRAWELLVPGGAVVYSTCSLTRMQNEEVIDAFMAEIGASVQIEQVPEANAWPCEQDAQFRVRFSPLRSSTGGLFICRLRKAMHTVD